MKEGGLTEGSQRRQSSTVYLDQKEQVDHHKKPQKERIRVIF